RAAVFPSEPGTRRGRRDRKPRRLSRRGRGRRLVHAALVRKHGSPRALRPRHGAQVTPGSPPQRPFSPQAYFDAADLAGARWWQESLRQAADPISRRRAIQALAVLGGSAAVFGLIAAFSASDDHVDISMDSLELQRREGWNVGQPDGVLRFPRSPGVDADGS